MNKSNSIFFLFTFFSVVFCLCIQIRCVDAQPNILVVPDDFAKIQDAIDAASDGDTVFVKSGTYNESISIDCSISVIGEDPQTTTLIGDYRLNGTIVLIQKNNVTFTGFSVKPTSHSSSRKGVHLLHVSYCTVFNNLFLNNGDGVWLYGSSFNNITGNTVNGMRTRSNGVKLAYSPNNWIVGNLIIQNDDGIRISESDNVHVLRNTILNSYDTGLLLASNNSNISENIIENQRIGLYLAGKNNFFRDNKVVNSTKNFDLYWVPSWSVNDFINDIDTSNTFDGIPIIYWLNKESEKVPETARVVVLVNCSNMIVENLNSSQTEQAIILVGTTNSLVTNTDITFGHTGFLLFSSTNNSIINNRLLDVGIGVYLVSSFNNSIRGNLIVGSSRGINLQSSSDNNVISNNSISGGSYRGINLDASDNNEIFFNMISDCRQGGVWIWNRASQNLFYLNNFVNNTENVEKYITDMQAFPKNIWDNGTIGNYWDDYVFKDENGNGIGDSSYVIAQNNQDNHPVMKPIDIAIIPEFSSYVCIVILFMALCLLFFKKRLII